MLPDAIAPQSEVPLLMNTTLGYPVIALTVAYDGARFSGFARQVNAITVQQRLEESLAIVLRRDVLTACAGRTDCRRPRTGAGRLVPVRGRPTRSRRRC